MPIGLPELIVVLVVGLLVLGPKRLPEAGRSLGNGLREFKESISGDKHPEQRSVDDGPTEQAEATNPDR